MGPERKPQLQSPIETERAVQEAAELISTSEKLVSELDELLGRAKGLVVEQKALVERLRGQKK
jgi:hypothetical protein